MNKRKKRFPILFALMAFIFTASSFPATAADKSLASEASYGLCSDKEEQFILADSSGEAVYVTITPLKTNARVNNGSYRVQYTKPDSWKASFVVSISNNQFTGVSSPYVVPIEGNISNILLKKTSSAQAKLTFSWKIPFSVLPISCGIKAYISNKQLKVGVI